MTDQLVHTSGTTFQVSIHDVEDRVMVWGTADLGPNSLGETTCRLPDLPN